MRAGWFVAIAAGAAIGFAAPMQVEAQGNSNRARQQQEAQRARQQAREQARREADRTRRSRERRQLPAGIVIRRNDRDRDDDRGRYDQNRRRYDDRYDWRDIFDRRDDRRDRDDRYDRYGRYDRRGPAFCRSGEGHPVHGRRWCRDKGFGLGRDRIGDIWGDIIFRDRRYSNRTMNRSVLERILGSIVLNRFDTYGRSYYGSGSLNGRWLDNRASVLQLYVGSRPIARLFDTNFDGRVDSVSLIN